nr:hypothetical protein BaRGS_015871 [Batillaria attramentaria]
MDGSRLPQEDQELTFEEAKTVVKEIQRRRWRQDHSDYNNSSYYHLSREDHVITVRLRTGHCRLKHHTFTKFNIDYHKRTRNSPCEEAKTVVKEIQRRRWRQDHPDYNNNDSYYHLSREDQFPTGVTHRLQLPVAFLEQDGT